jgi:Ca2+-binding RTX toxin-like protein
MSHRFLAFGLALFVTLLFLAAWPVLARGHTPNVNLPCTINGGEGPNYLVGTSGDDVISGRGGNDTISGQGGDDILKGGDGNDRIQGDSGSDAIFGGAGKDYLWARDALHDHVNGGSGYDTARIDPFKDRVYYVESHN